MTQALARGPMQRARTDASAIAAHADIADPDRLSRLGIFCRRMGRDAHQGEVGLVIGDEYLAFRDFSKE